MTRRIPHEARETAAVRYRREAEECRTNADRGLLRLDREALLRLAATGINVQDVHGIPIQNVVHLHKSRCAHRECAECIVAGFLTSSGERAVPEGRLLTALRFEITHDKIAEIEVIADPARSAALKLELPHWLLNLGHA